MTTERTEEFDCARSHETEATSKEENTILIQKARKLRRELRKNSQKGFTLIELLVVISILGILAAVVTMSMVGVTKLAQDRAAATELTTVQAAMDTMLNEQLVPPGNICPTPLDPDTNKMDGFPPGSKAGTTDGSPAGYPVPLYPRYLRQSTTHGTYQCDQDGVVTQKTYNPNS